MWYLLRVSCLLMLSQIESLPAGVQHSWAMPHARASDCLWKADSLNAGAAKSDRSTCIPDRTGQMCLVWLVQRKSLVGRHYRKDFCFELGAVKAQ